MVLFTYSLLRQSHINKKKQTRFFNFSCVYWCFTDSDIYRKSWPSRPRTSSALTTLFTTVQYFLLAVSIHNQTCLLLVVVWQLDNSWQGSITHVLCVANQYNYYYYLWFTKGLPSTYCCDLRAQHREIHYRFCMCSHNKSRWFWRTFYC